MTPKENIELIEKNVKLNKKLKMIYNNSDTLIECLIKTKGKVWKESSIIWNCLKIITINTMEIVEKIQKEDKYETVIGIIKYILKDTLDKKVDLPEDLESVIEDVIVSLLPTLIEIIIDASKGKYDINKGCKLLCCC